MTNKKIIHPNSLLTRRTAMSGLALGGAGLMAAGMSAPPTLAKTDWTLDLDSAEDNCKAMIKLQADLSGADTFGGFAGDVWAMVPNEGNFHVFNTYGIGASHVEYRPAERAWRFYHREALLYLDPQTNEILDSWYNPFTERRVEVLHIINEHVNRYYEVGGKDDTNLRNRKGGINFPRPYEVHGDNLLFRVSFYRLEDNVMPRKDYPLHSQSDKYQTTELWGMMGRLSEIMDPNVTSASCMTSWSRIAGWLPFMEMGDRPGQMVYHSHAYKMDDGPAELPDNIRAFFEKDYPEYFESPREWSTDAERVSTWTYSKNLIDKRRAVGLKAGETAFSWPQT